MNESILEHKQCLGGGAAKIYFANCAALKRPAILDISVDSSNSLNFVTTFPLQFQFSTAGDV